MSSKQNVNVITQTEPKYLTTIEAGKLLGYSRQHVGYLMRCKKPELLGKRQGRDLFVLESSALDYKSKYPAHRKTGPKTYAERLALKQVVTQKDKSTANGSNGNKAGDSHLAA